MKLTFERSKTSRSGLWVAAGAVVILVLVVLLLAVRNHRREVESAEWHLLEKGDALIRTIEAGTRAGMLRMRWGRGQLQHLLEETGRQPDVRFIAIVSPEGRILGHSMSDQIGTTLSFPERGKEGRGLRSAEYEESEGDRTFLVWREFKPLNRQAMGGRMGNHMDRMHGDDHMGGRKGEAEDHRLFPEEMQRPMIVLALDRSSYDMVRNRDLRSTFVISGLLLLLGVGGIVSLFWFQNYRMARENLKDTSAMAQEVVTSLPVGLMVVDRFGAVAFMNAAAEEISGLGASMVRGLPAADVLPDLMDTVSTSLDAGETLQEEERLCRFQGDRKVPLSISASSIVHEDGSTVGRVVILRDLREVKRLEKELRQKEKLAAIGDMAAGVAHEIRNPLSSIKGIATYFRSLFDETHDAREAAGVMIDEVDRLNRAVTELLTIAAPTRLVTARHDVGELVERSVRLVEAEAEALGVALSVDVPEKPMMAELDADRLTQSLLNLFLNALQAMQEGGGTLTVGLGEKDDMIHIAVSDSGCGMEPATLKSIFDPYYTTKAEGTGLGLAIVHKIVEAHGGSIDVVSRPGEGARFDIALPEKGGA
ncbi:PAS domain-containing sensor histidine kinase [Desulfoluna limicola]|uniref:histidine kinase n=1 Tax=Desulfoluna limicola TaxID=2810562 RepID=A0ABM7PI82_9BACT|nr:PAS domain-containing sensor histidine kinase [Desulfoluna limicola]BCS97291.1 PAS domain-containing sensor histidine kinase [Desulfoluna limicola]